jgi:hypothetical protein
MELILELKDDVWRCQGGRLCLQELEGPASLRICKAIDITPGHDLGHRSASRSSAGADCS